MKIFQVGGSIRDEILGVEANDKDWVVVGSSPEKMIAEGFKPIGKDFPVFLHPESNEEYALARTEKKSGKGYKGFTFYFDETVTLEEDLKRRDFTINSIAKDENGSLIDPHGGLEDLKDKIFRQTSESFSKFDIGEPTVARFDEPLPNSLGETKGDTTHFDIIDKWGNMIAGTPRGGWLQSSPIIPNLGFCLSNRGQMFWLDKNSPACIGPKRRPRTTLSPSLALKDGSP